MPDDPVAIAPTRAPEATIVVAVYNGAITIEACVASLLALRYPREDFEVIVVDNGSTDGTRGVLAAFGDQIRVLEEPTRGASAARNCGIRNARGGLIAFTDADCIVEADWLASLVQPLDDPSVGIVGGPILGRVAGNRIERFGELIHDQRRAIELDCPPYAASGNWGSRRPVLCEAGLFDETLLRGQDVDLAWRICQSGYRLVYAPSAIVRHRNERTVWGLMREGYLHGFHGIRVIEKHVAVRPAIRRWWTRTPVRLGRDLRQLMKGQGAIDSVLRLCFDAGKTAGELVALAQLGRGTKRAESGAHAEADRR